MEKYDILPTEENLRKTLKEDSPGRNRDIYSLLKILASQNGSWSIALNGEWGTGKTFFVKQTQYILDSLNISNDDNADLLTFLNRSEEDLKKIVQKTFRTIYYDAWEHDNDEDPIHSILSCIPHTKWSKEAKKVIIDALNVGARIIKAITPIDLESMAQNLKNNYDKYSQNLETLKKEFNAALDKLSPKDGQLIIFIDELDRCKPTYAVKLLERIKHYFNSPNITFIFSIDLLSLQNTVKHYYGEGFDGYHYLDRFFDLIIDLPDPDIEKYLTNTKNILQIEEIFGEVSENNIYHIFVKELIKHFSFSLRQINHLFLKINSVAYNFIHRNNNEILASFRYGEYIIYTFFLPFMCALSQSNISKYNRFVDGKADEEDLSFLAESSAFEKYYKYLFDMESRRNLDYLFEVKKIYNAIFGNSNNNMLVISDEAKIEFPRSYRDKLVKACTMLSESMKL